MAHNGTSFNLVFDSTEHEFECLDNLPLLIKNVIKNAKFKFSAANAKEILDGGISCEELVEQIKKAEERIINAAQD